MTPGMYLAASSLLSPVLISLLVFCTFLLALSKAEVVASIAFDSPMLLTGVTVLAR